MSDDKHLEEVIRRGEIKRYRQKLEEFRQRQNQRGKDLQFARATSDEITDDKTWMYLGDACIACTVILGLLRRGGAPGEVALQAAHLARLEEVLAAQPRRTGAALTALKRRKAADAIVAKWKPAYERLLAEGYGPEKARMIIRAKMKDEGDKRSERWLRQHLRPSTDR